MSRPRWRLYRTRRSGWAVHQSDIVQPQRYDSWTGAVYGLRAAISRWVVNDALDRAVAAPGEHEGVEAHLVAGDTIDQKRRALYRAAEYRGLSIRTWVEIEADPRETTFYIQVRRKS